MTRWIFIAVGAILMAGCNTLSDQTDVRNVRWGMSMAQVKETEHPRRPRSTQMCRFSHSR